MKKWVSLVFQTAKRYHSSKFDELDQRFIQSYLRAFQLHSNLTDVATGPVEARVAC